LSEPGAIIFDVDKVIARIEAHTPDMPKKQMYQAATQEFFNLANEAVRYKRHFTLETNFRDDQLADIVGEFKRHGYTTNMVYLTLESIKQSIYRVNKRVATGGHFVDHKNIRENYDLGLQYLERFADRFDNLKIKDASKGPGELKSLLQINEQQLVYLSDDLPRGAEQTIMNIADRFNSRGLDNDETRGPTHGRGR